MAAAKGWRRFWPVRPRQADTVRLPWWGLILSTRDKRVLKALLESGQRLTETLRTPGWQDVEDVIHDWQVRYLEQAQRLGTVMEERDGRMVLKEQDTPEDDRRRLIACAQAAALRGVVDELHQRARVGDKFLIRQTKERAIRGTEESSLV